MFIGFALPLEGIVCRSAVRMHCATIHVYHANNLNVRFEVSLEHDVMLTVYLAFFNYHVAHTTVKIKRISSVFIKL